MNPKSIRFIAKTMRDYGISELKVQGLQMSLMRDSSAVERELHKLEVGGSIPSPAPIPVDAPVSPEDPIKHKVEQLTSLMKLGDEELLDQLIPDHRPEADDEDIA